MPDLPAPGSPAFLELVERAKQRIFEETGVWVDVVDIGADAARDGAREDSRSSHEGTS